MKSEIWETVKLRLGLADDSLKLLVESYILEIEHRILHYCNISNIPTGLNFIWASMVIDAVRIDLPHVDEIADTTGGGETIKIGDTQISPSSVKSITNTNKEVIDKVVLNYRVDLNRYRKMRW